MIQSLTPESLRDVLGPTQPAALGHVDVLAEDRRKSGPGAPFSAGP